MGSRFEMLRHGAGHLAGLRDYDHAAGEYDNERAFQSVREAVKAFAVAESLLAARE